MISSANMDIRLSAKAQQVPLWQLAKQLGFSEPTLYRKLRFTLSDVERQQFNNALAKIVAERAQKEK